MKIRSASIVCAVILVLGSSLPAAAASFTFESVALGAYSPNLVVVDGAQTLTITAEGPGGFVQVQSAGIATGMGTRAVVGTEEAGFFAPFVPLRFTFSQAIDDITFRFGDGGVDDDGPVVIRGFNASDVLLGTLNGLYGAGQSASLTLSGSFAGASYFILETTNAFNPNSIFWEIDDYTLAAVPEPASLFLFGAAAIGVAMKARRSRKSQGR